MAHSDEKVGGCSRSFTCLTVLFMTETATAQIEVRRKVTSYIGMTLFQQQ